MYKILLKNSDVTNSWQIYGNPQIVNGMLVIDEFETEDKDLLAETIYELTKTYGRNNIRVIVDVPYEITTISGGIDGSKYEFFLVQK